jgi:hypothetical protein
MTSWEDAMASADRQVQRTFNDFIDGVLSGSRWNPATGPVTFSFPDSLQDYTAAERSQFLIPATGQTILDQVSAAQMDAIRFFARSVTQFTNLELNEVARPADDATADIRIAGARNLFGGTTAFPDGGGDMRLGQDTRAPAFGDVNFTLHGHELGHALGLKEGAFTTPPAFPVNVPVDRGGSEFSVMHKASFPGGPTQFLWANSGPFDVPQSYMMLDIAALQHLYGADYTFRTDDTQYAWDPRTGEMFVNGAGQGAPGGGAGGAANRIFLTTWDGGGRDAYNMSNYDNDVSIDLRPGFSSITSPDQLAILDTASGFRARGNVFNALLNNGDTRSLIEDATGGPGDDVMTGNQVGNTFFGGLGRDVLAGGLGPDVLAGGLGVDTYRGTLAELDGDLIMEYGLGEQIVVLGTVFGATAEAQGPDRTAIKIYSDGAARNPAATLTLDSPLSDLQDLSNLATARRLVVQDTDEGAVLSFRLAPIDSTPLRPTARVTVTVNSLTVVEAGEDRSDGDAEWDLTFRADAQPIFRLQDDSVSDNDVFQIGRSIEFTVPNFAPGRVVTLQAAGFELDAGGTERQALPTTEYGLSDAEFDLNLTTFAENDAFSYRASWSAILDFV